VGSVAPFQVTVEEAMKFVPVSVRENAAAPAITLLGASDDTEGTGFAALIVKVAALVVPPPGEGVDTVIAAVPAVLTSEAGTCAVSCVALTTVVGRALPAQFTKEEETKLVPLTVSTKAPEPATTPLGLNEDRPGAGLAAATTSVAGLEVPPPGAGFTTVTPAEVALATSEAGT